MTSAWIVRAGRNDEYDDTFFAQAILAVGWDRVANLGNCPNRPEIHEAVSETYPGYSNSTINAYTAQLYAFRGIMQPGDLVVLLRSNSPDLALGQITGDYVYRAESPHHARPARWLQRELLRGELGALMLDPPASSVVYRVNNRQLAERLSELAGQQPPKLEAAAPVDNEVAVVTSAAYQNLIRNLNYARNLTSAGSHLEQLKVAAFEVTDVYRAAWVQAVAALDHWVHQEIRDRMLAISGQTGRAKPTGYLSFDLSLGAIEDVHSGQTTLTGALEKRLQESLAYKTYQDPGKIKEGIRYVSNVTNLWQCVADEFSEQFAVIVSAAEVQSRLKEIVHRRNKIAHEYDEDPANPPSKRDIDAASTMQTIEWLDQLAFSLLSVLEEE